MSIRDSAIKNILKRKLLAEGVADKNLNKVLQDEEIRILFVACKRLVVQIAKLLFVQNVQINHSTYVLNVITT